MLPTGWLRGWTTEAAQILRLPTTPIEHGATLLRTWLRPPQMFAPNQNWTGDAEELIERLSHDRDRERELRRQQELINEELRRQLEALRGVSIDDHAGSVRLLDAVAVYAHNPTLAVGTVEINRGSRHGVRAASTAAHHSYVVGRVTDVRRLRSYVTPISHPSIGTMMAVVFSQDAPDVLPRADRRVLLEPRGRGVFHADIDRSSDVAVGDIVRLDDPTWHVAARGMIVGVVDAIEPNDEEPLRHRLIIRAPVQLHELSVIVLKIPVASDANGDDNAR